MSNFQFDNVHINNGKLLVCEDGVTPKAIKEKANEGKHSAYIEGPLQVGNAGDFSSPDPKKIATVMIGKDGNAGAVNALSTKGNVSITGDIVKVANVKSSAEVSAKKITADVKNFDIPHPSKEGWRLRYACIEGPEAGVYYRGRLKNQKVIRLPYYWKDLVSVDSITVQLQPIGAHQDIIVKRWDDENIYLQAQGGLPTNCFYHVYAERNDIDKLVVEYEVDKLST